MQRTVKINDSEIPVFLFFMNPNDYQKNLDDIVKDYQEDFINLLNWSRAVQEVIENEGVELTCNSFRLQEIRNQFGCGQFLVSADFNLKFVAGKTCLAKEIKDCIQVQGIRYSRGYRYWFLFEMSQSFLQLYMFPYYKY